MSLILNRRTMREDRNPIKTTTYIDNNVYHKVIHPAKNLSVLSLFIYFKSGSLEKPEAKPWENNCVVNE